VERGEKLEVWNIMVIGVLDEVARVTIDIILIELGNFVGHGFSVAAWAGYLQAVVRQIANGLAEVVAGPIGPALAFIADAVRLKI